MENTDRIQLPKLRPAAAVYGPETPKRFALPRFVAELQARGWRVGGLLQENLKREDGQKLGIDAIAIDTGGRIPITRYTDYHLRERVCGLDTGMLTESTEALRRAIRDRVDVLVVEKFSEREKEGGGFTDEILNAIAEGIPTLVAVSVDAMDHWNALMGGFGVTVPMEVDALWRWWGAHRLYRDLELSVGADAGVAKRVVIGLNFTLVEGPNGCGMAQTPPRDAYGCRPVRHEGGLAGQPLQDLAKLVHSWNPTEAAVGLAAINAHTNRYDLRGEDVNGLDAITACEGPVTVVGRFPKLSERLGEHQVIEREPRDGEYPANAASYLLPNSDGVVLTASALVDHGLPDLIEASGNAMKALVGPSTPLSPRLHSYGLAILSGLVIEDADGAARAVAEGGATGAMKNFGRFVTIQEDG